MEDFTTPFMYDRNDKGGGLLLYIGGWGGGIPSRLLQSKLQ